MRAGVNKMSVRTEEKRERKAKEKRMGVKILPFALRVTDLCVSVSEYCSKSLSFSSSFFFFLNSPCVRPMPYSLPVCDSPTLFFFFLLLAQI